MLLFLRVFDFEEAAHVVEQAGWAVRVFAHEGNTSMLKGHNHAWGTRNKVIVVECKPPFWLKK